MDTGKFRFYCGAASGSGRKVLRQLEESDVMISYATKNNTAWEGIENLFIDNGAYSLLSGGEYADSVDDYLAYLNSIGADYYTLRDVIGGENSVSYAQSRTVDLHRENLCRAADLGVSAEPVCVLQGWTPRDYVEHIDDLREHGVLTRYVGIGGLKRGQNPSAHRETVREIILSVREALPSSFRIHAFGATVGDAGGRSPGVLQYPEVHEAIASADSQSYEFRRGDVFNRAWRNTAREYIREMHALQYVTRQGDLPAGFESPEMDSVVSELVQDGYSPAQALDVYMTQYAGMGPSEWARMRGVTPGAVCNNVRGAYDGD